MTIDGELAMSFWSSLYLGLEQAPLK